MRFMHIADLHLGKKLNGYSLLEDQRAILEQIATIACEEGVDAVLVAGDVYDRPVPPEGAVGLLDWFLAELHRAGVEVFMVPGNHDSAGRLSFLAPIVGLEGVHIAEPYVGAVEMHRIEREGATAQVFMLPFITPSDVRHYHGDAEVSTYDEALRYVLGQVEPVEGACSILLAHQLVLGSGELVRSESEQVTIGGLEQVGADAFERYDYVALGHIHAPQWVSKRAGDADPDSAVGGIRYAGSPLMYSFSEVAQRKSATIVDVYADGAVKVSTLPLVPLHGMREVRGGLAELRELAESDPTVSGDYIRATLTEPVMDAKARLKDLFPLLMRIDFDYFTEGAPASPEQAVEDMEKRSPIEVFEMLFESTYGREMSEGERSFLDQLASEVLAPEGGAR